MFVSVLNMFLITYCPSTFSLDFHNQFTFLLKFHLTSSFCWDEVAEWQKFTFFKRIQHNSHRIATELHTRWRLNQRIWKTETNINSTTHTHLPLEILMPFEWNFYWKWQKHFVKSVQIWNFFWFVFSCIRTRKNSLFGHFSRSENFLIYWFWRHQLF